jgi:hypothetical protein
MRLAYFAFALAATPVCALAQGDTQIRKLPPSSGFLKHLTLESFGYRPSANLPADEFAPTTTSSFYNLRELECPLCIPGTPPGRTRAVLPPFGAKAAFGLWHDRLILFAGYSGIDAIANDNAPRLNPSMMRATPFNDDWLVQTEFGTRVFLDRQKLLALGITQSYVHDYGPGKMRWSKTAVSVSFSPRLFKQIFHGVRNAGKHSTHSHPDL